MGKAQTESNYKRLQRFLREFDLDYYASAKLVTEMMKIPEPWVLSVDRTEWKFGRKFFNILTLGVVYLNNKCQVSLRARRKEEILGNFLSL